MLRSVQHGNKVILSEVKNLILPIVPKLEFGSEQIPLKKGGLRGL